MKLYLIILLFLSFLIPQRKYIPEYTKKGVPTSEGIEFFIKYNEERLIAEYEQKIDSIYDIYVEVENLSELYDYDTLELGRFYDPDYIILTNEERYIGYEFSSLSKTKQRNLLCTDRTVKAVLFHELTHVYFNQVILKRKQKEEYICSEYGSFRMFPQLELRFGTEFIEEGICEYTVIRAGENIYHKDIFIPKTAEDVVNTDNKYFVVYQYSVKFLSHILDTMNLEQGIELLISNKPPNYQEILNPELYYKRLNQKTWQN
jgi:hypothetical protein